MKTKEEILEGYFGSDYWLLKERDDLQYILRSMDEYANQFKQLHKPVVMQGLLSKCPHCHGTGTDPEIPNYDNPQNSSPTVGQRSVGSAALDNSNEQGCFAIA